LINKKPRTYSYICFCDFIKKKKKYLKIKKMPKGGRGSKNPTQGMGGVDAKAEALDSHVNKISDAAAHRTHARDAGVSAAVSQFPGYYHDKATDADTRMAYRWQAAQPAPADGGANGLGNFRVQLTDRDIEFYEKRRKEQNMFNFDKWLLTNVNVADPNTARWMQEKYPEFWERREKYIDDQADLQARAAKIKIRGAQSKEDWIFLWAVSTGQVQLNPNPLYNLNRGPPAGVQFNHGIFNPKRYVRGAIGGNLQTLQGAGDIAGLEDALEGPRQRVLPGGAGDFSAPPGDLGNVSPFW
jgi:hypothetical protein